MDYDYKTHRWQTDIKWFGIWKNQLNRLLDVKYDWAEEHRERIRTRLREIQQRWPQFIKEDEIP